MCVFCKIINGEIPSKKIYEDKDTLAILDISQATKGHTLIMPKKHYDNLLTIDPEDYKKVMSVAKKVAEKVNNVYKPLGINLLNNCGEAAGQSVMHFHVHILPRYTNSDVDMKFTNHMDQFNLDEIAEALKLQ